MAFDNNYPNRKDRRRPYYGSARICRSCRPGGDCPQCRQEAKKRALKREATRDAMDDDTDDTK